MASLNKAHAAELFVPVRQSRLVAERLSALERQVAVLFGGLICSWLAFLALSLRIILNGQ